MKAAEKLLASEPLRAISTDKACQTNDEGVTHTFGGGGFASLESCKEKCLKQRAVRKIKKDPE